MENKLASGVLSFAILPAANYFFKVVKNYSVLIPSCGCYNDIVEEEAQHLFKDKVEFNIFNKEDSVLVLPEIVRVLFATKKYPELLPGQVFVPTLINIGETEIGITGQIVEFLTEEKYKEELAMTLVKKD